MKNKILLIFLLSVCCMRGQTVYYVSCQGNDEQEGKSWATAKRNVQSAIDAAQPGDEVWVSAGVYYPTSYIADSTGEQSSKSILMKDGVSLFGGFSGTELTKEERVKSGPAPWEFQYETVLSGKNIDCDHVVWSSDEENGFSRYTCLDGFSVTEGSNGYGKLNNYGQGIYACKNVEVLNCRIYNNFGTYGAGIYNRGIVKGCMFYENKGISGVGIFNSGGLVTGCTIQDNTYWGLGGGIYNDKEGIIEYCNIFRNSIPIPSGMLLPKETNRKVHVSECEVKCGGGIYNASGTVRFCSIRDNSSGRGGGIWNGTYCTVDECIVTDNDADIDFGGGIYNQGIVSNCNIRGNIISNMNPSSPHSPLEYAQGGGVYNDRGKIFGCSVTKNSLWVGHSGSGAGIYNYKGSVANSEITYNYIEEVYMNAPIMTADCIGIFNDEGIVAHCTIISNYFRNTRENKEGSGNMGIIINSILSGTIWGTGECQNCVVIRRDPDSDEKIKASFDEVRFLRPIILDKFMKPFPGTDFNNMDWHILEGSTCINKGIEGQIDSLGITLNKDLGAYPFVHFMQVRQFDNVESDVPLYYGEKWNLEEANEPRKISFENYKGNLNSRSRQIAYSYRYPLLSPVYQNRHQEIRLDYDLRLTCKNKEVKDRLTVLMLSMGTNKQDTLAVHTTGNNSLDSTFTHYFTSDMNSSGFQVLFVAEGANQTDSLIWSLSNILVRSRYPDALSMVESSRLCVYPNPVEKGVYVRPLKAGTVIKIFDMTGCLIRNIRAVKEVEYIPLDDVKPGIYIVSVTEDDITVSRKIMKIQ